MKKPVIAITLGDPAGIGPEVVLKSLKSQKIYDACRPLVIGDAQVLSIGRVRTSLKIRPIVNPQQALYRFGTLDVLHLPCADFEKLEIGVPNAQSGMASFESVEKSVELALLELADGVVHAPISKTAWKMAGVRFPGHTELIASLCQARRVAMAIASEPLRTVMVTRHIPLNQVSKNLKPKDILEAIELARDWMADLKIKNPRIAVCGLNPHAGERGLLGWEEMRVIGPCLVQARKKLKCSIAGPLPADSAFRDHRDGLFDCLITMYHDQSLIPLKLFNADALVNITLGLPFPRTSPGHGTAFDIAGKNIAGPKAMMEAVLTAARLCSARSSSR